MRACTFWALLLVIGCSGAVEKSDGVDGIQMTPVGVDEDSETPLFGGMAEEEHEATSDFDVQVAQASGINLVPSAYTPPAADDGGAGTEGVGGKVAGKKKPARTWKRSQITPNTSKLTVGDDEELPLEAMQATVAVDGFRARVVLDCVYRNTTDRQLEGTFRLRLPNEAVPFYLAFGKTAPQHVSLPVAGGTDVVSIRRDRAETWEKPKEGRLVPKKRAARAYGEIVRRRVDPALLEWSGAGVFSTRVFPIEPKQLHRVVIGYEVNLAPVGDDLEYRLDLPENVPDLTVTLDVHADGHEVTPAVAGADGIYRYRNPDARTFRVRLNKPGTILLQGNDAAAGDLFAMHFRADVPAREEAPAERALFLVDTSLSSNPERFNVWLKLLEAILEKNRPELAEFGVVFFNIETFRWRESLVPNTKENAAALLADAQRLALEGATDLDAALREAARFDAEAPLFLLSDGAATWGEGDLHLLARRVGDRALFAYSTGFSGTDRRLLDQLTRQSGGAVFNVAGEAALNAAAMAHTRRPWRIDSIAVDGGADLMLAGRPTTLFSGQTLYVAGRGRPRGDLVVSLSQGEARHELRVAPGKAISSELAPSVYGHIAVGQLEEFGAATRTLAENYAMQFRVVGKSCSLLMLETEEDYAEFGLDTFDPATEVRRKATDAIDGVESDLVAALADPQAKFRTRIAELVDESGITFADGTRKEILALVDRMPAAAFRVDPEPLRCDVRTWKKIPGAVQEGLASKKLTYDAATVEAKRRGGGADSLKALSSLVEQRPGDGVLARDVGYSALEWDLGGQAYHLFRRVAEARPWEPAGYVAMARCLADLGRTDLALLWYEVAVSGAWDERFQDFGEIARVDYYGFLRRIENGELTCSVKDFAGKRRRQLEVAPADLVVIIEWNTDNTDIDLHVVDPNKEECYYEHRETKIGGRLTRDVTEGYGPEMFVLKNAVPGEYRIDANFYSANRNRLSARTKVYVTVIRRFGTKNAHATRQVALLKEGKERHTVARVKW